MNNKLLATVVIVALAILGFWYFSQQSVQAPGADEAMEENTMEVADEATVTYTDDGFEPSLVVVGQGGTVRFVNESSSDFWPASAMHPTHAVYPGSNIELCSISELGTLFDSCGAVAPGETWSFTFDEIGEWGYHNHLNASYFGRVEVR